MARRRRLGWRAAIESAGPSIFVGLAATAIVVLRLALGAHSLHTIWAEDGATFLQGAIDRPLGSLFDSYNGYGHLVPRVLAEAGHVVPVEHWSTLTVATSAIILGFVSSVTYWYARTIRLVPLAAVLAALVPAIVPGYGISSLASWAHLQWVLAYGFAWILLAPIDTRARVLPAVFAAVTVASGPVGILACPLVLLHGRRWYRHPAVPGIALGVLYQVVIRLMGTGSRVPGFPDVVALARVIGQAMTDSGGGVIGGRVFYTGIVVVVLIVIAIAVAPNRRDAWGLLACAALSYVAQAVFNGGQAVPRYGAHAASLVVASLLAGYGTTEAWKPRYRWLVFATCAFWVLTLPPSPYRATGPPWSRSVERAHAECADAGDDTVVELPIAPKGWTVELRCDEVA